jgi:16S rRNA (guanine1207-N2)-methyltransferase
MWADATKPAKLPKGLDFIIMNPPFHDGGTEALDLGRAFIASAAATLRDGGACILVANRHLPYEAEMEPLFAEVRLLAQTGGFKVYAARK